MLLVIPNIAVLRGGRLSPRYLENLSQNQTTSKSMEIYVVMVICSAEGLTIKCYCDPKVQPLTERVETEVAALWVIAVSS